MSDDGKDDNKPNIPGNEKLAILDKTKFGSLSPLTAAQVVALLIKSDLALGGACACACACACGGPCY